MAIQTNQRGHIFLDFIEIHEAVIAESAEDAPLTGILTRLIKNYWSFIRAIADLG